MDEDEQDGEERADLVIMGAAMPIRQSVELRLAPVGPSGPPSMRVVEAGGELVAVPIGAGEEAAVEAAEGEEGAGDEDDEEDFGGGVCVCVCVPGWRQRVGRVRAGIRIHHPA